MFQAGQQNLTPGQVGQTAQTPSLEVAQCSFTNLYESYNSDIVFKDEEGIGADHHMTWRYITLHKATLFI